MKRGYKGMKDSGLGTEPFGDAVPGAEYKAWEKRRIAALFLCVVVGLSLAGLTGPSGVSFAQQGKAAAPEITNIEVLDYSLRITVPGGVKYKVLASDDPFKVLIDLEGARLGKFSKRIASDRPGITEINPLQIESPAVAARLDVLLTSPMKAVPEVRGDTLTVKFQEVKAAEGAAAASMGKKEASWDVMAREIREVSFETEGNRVDLRIRGDGALPEPSISQGDTRILIEIPDVEMKAPMPTVLPGPVREFKFGVDLNRIRFTLDMRGRTEVEVASADDEVVIALKTKEMPAKKDAEKAKRAPISSELVSLDFQDGDVVAILRLLGDVSGYNIVLHPDVKGKITMKLTNVPWEQAFDLVLKTFSLDKDLDGNVIRIAPMAVFAKERQDESNLRRTERESEPLETRVFSVSYADPAVLQNSIKDSRILTSRGSMSFDKRTSSLVVNDIPATFGKIDALLVSLDKATSQVQIEARIVEISTQAVKDLGIQWGIGFRGPLWSIGGNQSLGTGPFGLLPNVVNTPAANPASGVSFGIINAAGTFGLDVQLTAIEAAGRARIISNPRVVTLDNEKAKILQGESIPYAQRDPASGQISAAFKDVAIQIEVTPHITPSNSVLANVMVNKEDLIDFVPISAGSTAPRTTKIESRTNVLIETGETIVIGGLLKRTERNTSTGVPVLKNVPGLGWLFKNDRVEDTTSELIIFITPRIIKR